MTDISRRTLLSATAAVTALAASPRGRATAAPGASRLKIGLASYSMHKQTFDQVVDVCKQANIKYVSLKDMHLPFKSTPEQLAAAHSKLAAAGTTLVSVGVIYMKDVGEVRQAFDYARAAKAPMIVGAPDPSVLDEVEKAIKATGIPVAIHNHGPDQKHWQSPREVLPAIKSRDKRLGVCMDIGHTVRAGVDPVAMVDECGDRLLDLHVKDLKDKTVKSERVPVGSGIIDIVGLMRALDKRRFSGHIAIEYEAQPDNPVPGIRESLAYLRGVAATLASQSA